MTEQETDELKSKIYQLGFEVPGYYSETEQRIYRKAIEDVLDLFKWAK